MIKQIDYYVTKKGKEPFLEWVNSLDTKTEAIIDRHIKRVAQGGAKKSIKNLKDGVFEIKIPYAGGMRVYFAEYGQKIILLLGGDKSTQQKDVKKSKRYRRCYCGKQA